MPHAYTEDQQAQRTLTRRLAEGSELKQPAKAGGPPSPWPYPKGRGNDGLFAEQMASPYPHPRPFSHWEKGGRPAGLRVRSLLPPEVVTAGSISGIDPVSPAGEIECFQ